MRHGPGKYEGCDNYALVSAWIQDNVDEQLGDSEGFGWYGKFSGKIKGRGPFYAIVYENSQGFVDVDFYDTEKKLDDLWASVESDYEEFSEESDD